MLRRTSFGRCFSGRLRVGIRLFFQTQDQANVEAALLRWRQVLVLAGTLLLVACAPRVQPYETPFGSPQLIDQDLKVNAATLLPVRSWLPAKTEPLTAIIIGVHGFNDYSNAFLSPGLYFAGNGVGVYAYDQRGFGAAKERGIWAGEENLKSDLAQMVRAVRAKHPDVPVYILGESMGGAVVMTALADADFPKVDGIILSAPAVWGSKTMNKFYQSTLWMAAHTIPWKRVSGRGLKILASDNFDMLRAMGNDPLIIKETRIDAIYGIVQLMDDAYGSVEKIKVPVLLLYGMNDQVIPNKPIFDIASRLDAPYKLAYYPEGYHMLLRDLKATAVMDDVLSWVNDRDAFLPSGYDLNWRALVMPEDEDE